MVARPQDDQGGAGETPGAVAFHSQISSEFHDSYETDPNRIARAGVWRSVIARNVARGRLAYDFGCGSGMITCEVAPYAERVIAVDGSDVMLALARRTLAEAGFSDVDYRRSLLPPSSDDWEGGADTIICSSVIEYLDSVGGMLRFLQGLLRPGGALIFSISNRHSLKRNLVRATHRLTGRPAYVGFVRHLLSEADVRRELEAAGLTFVESEYFDGADRLNRFLALFLPKRLATNMIIAVARRPD